MNTIIEITFVTLVIVILFSNIIVTSYLKKLKALVNETELSGFEIAKTISTKLGNIEPHIIKKTSWRFLDHYNITRNVIKLSPEVFNDTNMYASLMALNISLETLKDNIKLNIIHKTASFLVIAFYLLLIIGALANKYPIIYLSFLIFIFAFLLEIIYISLFLKNNHENKALVTLLNKEEIIKPKENFQINNLFYYLIALSRLPYNFLIYFL